jgi:hypothetical protein
LRAGDEHSVDFLLRNAVESCAFAGEDLFSLRRAFFEHRGIDQPIVDDHLRSPEDLQTADGEQPGITGPGTNEVNRSDFHE